MTAAPLLQGRAGAGTNNEPPRRILSASLTPPTVNAIHVCARWLGSPTSLLVKAAVAEYLERHAEELAPIQIQLDAAVAGLLAPDQRLPIAGGR